MLKCIFLVAAGLIGGVAAEGINQQDQIYVVSGVLGGVCLLLTIAVIVNTINIINLQTKVAVLQATNTASSKTVTGAPRAQQPQPRPEELNQYSAHEDPYRAGPQRQNYRMDRLNPEYYYEDNRHVMNGPTPPPRPQRVGPSARDNYY